MAEDVARQEWIRADGRAAIPARGPQVVQPFEVAALAFPVADGVIDKFKLAQTSKVRDGKNGIEHALEPGVFTFTGKQIHLQKPFIRFLLDLNEVRDGYRSFDS